MIFAFAFAFLIGLAPNAFAVTCPAGGPTSCATLSGDGTLATGGVLTVSKIGGVSISLGGTFATTGAAASTLAFPVSGTPTYTFPSASQTLASLGGTETFTNKTFTAPTINGGALSGTFSGNFTLSGVPILSGLSSGTCANGLSLDSGNHIVETTCSGGGSGTINTGSSPAIAQYQGAASTTVGPATVSGDATLAAGGALTVSAIGGKAVSLGAALTTTGTSATTLAFPSSGTPTYTFPSASKTLMADDLSNATGWPTTGDLMLAPSSGAPTAYGGSSCTGSQFVTGLAATGVVSCAAGSTGANPTATAGPTANNGSATTFMRSDASPAVQVGSASQEGILEVGTNLAVTSGIVSVPTATTSTLGVVKPDGSTITISGGVISSTSSGSVPVNAAISSATTLSNSNIGANPVTGAGYTITLPASGITASQPITLAAQSGTGPVYVCPGASASFATNSGAPLVPGLCSGGNPGAVIYNGLTLTVIYVSGGTYFAALSAQTPQAVNPQAFYVGDGTAAPASIFANTSAAEASGSTLTFSAVPKGVMVGMVVQDATSPTGLKASTTITAVASTTITLSQAVASGGVGSGDSIAFSSHGASASDSNPGTLTAPFSTIQHCIFAAQASASVKTCYVRKGIYDFTYTGPWFTTCGGQSGQSYAIGINSQSAGTLSGLTISYYPPDGLGSAVLLGDGGTTNARYAMCQYNGSGFTTNTISIIGLSFPNWPDGAWDAGGSDGTGNDVFEWNSVSNTTDNACCYDTVMWNQGSGKNTKVLNNFIYNVQRAAISFDYNVALGTTLISNNIIEAASNGVSDLGDIYLVQTTGGSPVNCNATGTIAVQNNWIDNATGTHNHNSMYNDDGQCNVTWTGNVVIAPGNYAAEIHGGSNIVYNGNIIDLGAGATGGLMNIVNYDNDGAGSMTGNVFENNFITCNESGTCGAGYVGANTPPNPMTISNNGYHNYNGGASGGVGGVNASSSGNAGTPSGNLSVTSPGVTCWNTLISPTSALITTILPNDLGRAWGLPSLVGASQAGAVPSWGPTC